MKIKNTVEKDLRRIVAVKVRDVLPLSECLLQELKLLVTHLQWFLISVSFILKF